MSLLLVKKEWPFFFCVFESSHPQNKNQTTPSLSPSTLSSPFTMNSFKSLPHRTVSGISAFAKKRSLCGMPLSASCTPFFWITLSHHLRLRLECTSPMKALLTPTSPAKIRWSIPFFVFPLNSKFSSIIARCFVLFCFMYLLGCQLLESKNHVLFNFESIPMTILVQCWDQAAMGSPRGRYSSPLADGLSELQPTFSTNLPAMGMNNLESGSSILQEQLSHPDDTKWNREMSYAYQVLTKLQNHKQINNCYCFKLQILGWFVVCH